MKHAFLINTITGWDEPPRARHHVAFSLSKIHTVVFVEANKTGFPAIRTRKVHENLTLITPYFPIDMRIRYRIPVLNEIYQYWLFRNLVRHYRDHKVINFDFTASRIFRFFRNVIYYCNDSFSEISKKINPAPIAKYHKRCEATVASRSGFCVGISLLIKNYLLQYNPNTIEIPLGSPNITEYKIAVQRAPSKNKKVRVVLVAVIKRLNMSSNVINLLLRDESISLTLIGPVEEAFLDEIEDKDRLILRGSLYGRELYGEMNQFDVAIAPYCTRSKNEIFTATGGKIYHYLSVGKPVVISYMPGLDQLNLEEKIIYPAGEEEDFPGLVHRAHEENTAELIQKRVDYANRNTWDQRMAELVAHYESV